MGNLPFKNHLDLICRAAARRGRHKSTHLIGEREIRLVRNAENVSHLGGNGLLGYTLAVLQADAFCRDCLQASAIVQLIGFWLPKNGVDIEKVMPQQLLNGVRFRSAHHVGVIFHAPQIEDQTLGAQATLYSAERIRRKNGVAQVPLNFVNGTRSENHNINVCGLRLDFQHSLQK